MNLHRRASCYLGYPPEGPFLGWRVRKDSEAVGTGWLVSDFLTAAGQQHPLVPPNWHDPSTEGNPDRRGGRAASGRLKATCICEALIQYYSILERSGDSQRSRTYHYVSQGNFNLFGHKTVLCSGSLACRPVDTERLVLALMNSGEPFSTLTPCPKVLVY